MTHKYVLYNSNTVIEKHLKLIMDNNYDSNKSLIENLKNSRFYNNLVDSISINRFCEFHDIDPSQYLNNILNNIIEMNNIEKKYLNSEIIYYGCDHNSKLLFDIIKCLQPNKLYFKYYNQKKK